MATDHDESAPEFVVDVYTILNTTCYRFHLNEQWTILDLKYKLATMMHCFHVELDLFIRPVVGAEQPFPYPISDQMPLAQLLPEHRPQLLVLVQDRPDDAIPARFVQPLSCLLVVHNVHDDVNDDVGSAHRYSHCLDLRSVPDAMSECISHWVGRGCLRSKHLQSVLVPCSPTVIQSISEGLPRRDRERSDMLTDVLMDWPMEALMTSEQLLHEFRCLIKCFLGWGRSDMRIFFRSDQPDRFVQAHSDQLLDPISRGMLHRLERMHWVFSGTDHE